MSDSFRWRTEQESLGKEWFASLSPSDKWVVSEDMLSGTINGRDWGFDRKPSLYFRRGVRYALHLWLQMNE